MHSRRADTRTAICRTPPTLTVAATVAAILAGATSAVHAQDAGIDEPVQQVVVTGIRHSIESSIAVKKASDSITESVTAEDIGKLPDTSIAESIARLPGLAAQRVNGRAQVISIRGLGPRYGATLLNGREMVSTGDNRSVELDQFPSELINSATIFKTPDATLVGQGLSGTLNMQTVRPLQVADTQIAVNLRFDGNSNGKLNADSKSRGGRASVSYVTQFRDNTVGLAVGLAYLDQPNQEEHYKSWWWADTGQWGAPLGGTPDGSIALQGFEAGAASTEQKRTGVMAVLEFRPTDTFHSMVDLYYSKFDQTENRRTLMSDLSTWGGASYSNSQTSDVNGDTLVTGGTIDGVKPVLLTSLNDRQDDIKAIGWNNALELGDNWTAVADLSYSEAQRDEQNAELQAGFSGPVSLGDVAIATGDGRSMLTPNVDFASNTAIVLMDPMSWGRDGRSQFPKVNDKLKSARLSFGRQFESVFHRIDFGANLSERTKEMNRSEVYYNLLNGRAPTNVSEDLIIRSTSLGFGGIPGSILAFNFPGVLAKYYDVAVPAALDQAPGRIWNVDEEVTTGFAMLGYKFDTRIPIHGNLGLQVVHADQKSTGFIWDGSANVPISDGTTYTDTLPSLNLIFDLPADTYVRLGAAKTLSRPNMEDMRAGFSDVGVGTQPPFEWSANGGNPQLEPWRANAYDISIEKYFGRRSYVAGAWFYKDLKNFVYSQTIRYDFTGFPNPSAVTPSSPIGNLNTQANGNAGLVAGFELTLSLDAGLFTPVLEGFGVQFNGSDTRSSLHEGNDPTKPLDGLSGRVTNVSVYYEDHGFSARLAQRHRSRFVTTVRGTFGENVPSAIEAESIVDAQLGYAFSDESRLKGLSLLAQVNNLTDEPYRTTVGISVGSVNPLATLPERYTTYGREYLIGFNYKL